MIHYSDDEKKLWAAVLATAVDDATRNPTKAWLKSFAPTKEELRAFRVGLKTGYAMPTREAVLSWMRDGLKDPRAGSFNWICQVLDLNAQAILEKVESQPDKINPRAMNHLRGNQRGLTRNGKAKNFGTP